MPLLYLILFQEDVQVQLVGENIDGLNTLGIIVMSVVIGMALRKNKQKGKALIGILCGINVLAKHVVKLIMW